MGRRAFLGAAALALAGGAAGCTDVSGAPGPAPGATTAPPPPPPPSPPPSTAADPRPPDWIALRSRLSGRLVLPADRGYGQARRVYNTLFDGRRPAAVAHCAGPEDVQACVDLAAAARMPVAARSGGHSYAGYSSPDGGLVVDLGPMSGVRVEADGTAVVAAGTRLIDLVTALAAKGRCLPTGSCPSVGIGGLTLGGGIGVLSRKYGLTCDRLVSAQVVTAGGELRTVSTEEEPELFWALRGGGGGNFGIVTSFTFATEPAPDLVVFSLRFDGQAADVLAAWQDWIPGAPEELWSNCVIEAGSPPRARIGGCFVGDEAACRRQLDRLAVDAGTSSVTALGYLDAMRFFAGCERPSAPCRPEDAGRDSFVASSRMLEGPADPAAVVSLLDGLTGLDLLLDSLGGAVAAVEPAATAFPHRGALASAQIFANTDGGRDLAARQVAEVRTGLGRIAGARGYVNYIDPELPDWANAYYGANLPRLRAVAADYDPDGVFAFAQGLTARGR
ncbi:FAD-binding oxidoreductase [Actinophytocola xanthii]|uniref:FAD-binding oxidoreductase n=1 Tax=Actinophytocola xanthii TaxID=1912961 RepID=UPI0038BADB0E